ncbi:MAG: prepilin-type N-terminal cleavage/methylation domain-containing protein [Planctomycetes bacterium]|nr:prepilin-type N-terminal cleavage/methylation domain-containing protein [Planctomycetota bacterium]
MNNAGLTRPRRPGPTRESPHQRPRRRSGFTLIEVLVVVAIIALLVAILLPSLARARDLARQSVCFSNCHQMSVALTLYTIHHRHYPGHHSGKVIYWPPRLLRYVGKQNRVFWCPNAPPETYWNGKDQILSQKPAAGAKNQIGTFSYGYNDWGVGDSIKGFTNLGLGAWVGHATNGELKVDKVKRPQEMIAIADNDVNKDNLYSNKVNNFDTAIDPNTKEAGEYPGDRHRKGANVAFCDGHAEWLLQKALIEPRKRMRQRWNNDFKNHCALWEDLPAAMPCSPGE